MSPMENLDFYLKVAQEATALAAPYIHQNYGVFNGLIYTSGVHYETKDDAGVNQIIESYLHAKTPQADVYSESGSQDKLAELTWIVDPIDGTTSHRAGIPLFVSQICLLYKGEPLVSVLSSPVLGFEYTAKKDGGAYLNGRKIQVSDTKKLEEAVCGLNKGTHKRDVSRMSECLTKLGADIRTVRMFGSTGIHLSYVASGKIDVNICIRNNIYDDMPGVLLVREAGGVALNLEGKDWSYKDDELIVGNKELAREVVKILK